MVNIYVYVSMTLINWEIIFTYNTYVNIMQYFHMFLMACAGMKQIQCQVPPPVQMDIGHLQSDVKQLHVRNLWYPQAMLYVQTGTTTTVYVILIVMNHLSYEVSFILAISSSITFSYILGLQMTSHKPSCLISAVAIHFVISATFSIGI